MKFRRIENFLVGNKIFISLCAALFYWTGYMILARQMIAPPYPTILIVFFSTLLVYRIKPGKFPRLLFNKHSALLLPLIVLLSVFYLHATEILLLFHLALLSFFYYYPEKGRRYGFRSVPYLKIFLVAYVWAAMSSFLPAIELGQPVMSGRSILLFAGHFCFIAAIVIPFDIRDIQRDKHDHTRTLPHFLGTGMVKIAGVLLVTIFAGLILALTQDFYLAIVLFVAAALLILRSEPHRPGYYFGVFVDGLIALYFISGVLHFIL